MFIGSEPIGISRYYFIIKPYEEIFINHTDLVTVFDGIICSESDEP